MAGTPRSCFLACLVSAGVCLPALAIAQAASPAVDQGTPVKLEEVVVTAQKRSERLQDVPISVTAIQGPALEQMQATRLEDWAGYVPGLSIGDAGAPGQSFLALDGIAPISAASEVGMYINDTPVGSSSSFEGANGFAIDLMPYDLDRIEVLRGPQGTLYGASTMGGLIKYVLSTPNLTDFSARVGGDLFGIQNANSPGGGGRGEINLPLVQGQLAVSLSAYNENTPGYIDDVTTGRKGDNPLHQTGGRFALLWKPGEDLSVEFGAIYQDSHADNFDFVALDPVSGLPAHGSLSNINSLPEPYTQKLELFDITLKWDMHWATLTSISSYQNFANDTYQDLTDYIGVYLGALGAPSAGLSNLDESYRLEKATEELRLGSPEGQRISWLAGLFYTHEQGDNNELISAFDSPGVLMAGFNPVEFVDLPSTYEEYAFFGQATYHFTDQFDLTAGVRYAHNRQTFIESEGGELVNPAAPAAPAVSVPGSSEEGVTTYSVSPSMHITKDTLAYVRVASGYQPGGPNVILPGEVGLPTQFGSSRLTDYQIGGKATLLNGAATADLSAFYIDWTRIQVSVLVGDQSAIENAGKARSEGLDFNTSYSPLVGLKLGANVAYADAYLTEAVPSIGANSGARLPYIPSWSGAVTADYSHTLNAQWEGFVGGGARYVGSRYSDVEGSTSNGELQGYPVKAYAVVDMHLGAKTHDLTISLFAKNLANRSVFLAPANYFDDVTGAPIDIKAPRLQPRTIGLSVDKSF